MAFIACRVFRKDEEVEPRIVEMETEELSPGEVLIRAEWSGVNYKDALAVTGRGKILRHYPLNPGIDVAGRVVSSSDPGVTAGESVLVNGMGLGEMVDGGFAQYVRVLAAWVIRMPDGLTPFDAMTLGTAGFTAALCLHRMEVNGQAPGQGPIVVTGATGGVGSAAVSMFAARGYEVVAVSGRPEHEAYLRALGASQVATVEGLQLGSRPLDRARFAGVVDNVGGSLLAALLRHVQPWGNVATVGMAGGAAFEATVFPFILRGVSLLGASSTDCPMPLRRQLWERLGSDLKPRQLGEIAGRVVGLADVVSACESLMSRAARGRVVVDCR